jgi:hypothetical protein
MFRHPKYYKELRKLRNKLDQAISHSASTEANSRRAPGPGPKQQAIEETVPHNDIEEAQASSVKPQAPEASSGKHQAPSNKRQA